MSRIALFPLQDILRLGSNFRFNIPGTVGNNWGFRFDWGMIKDSYFDELKHYTERYGRG